MIKFGVIGYGYWGPNVARNITTSANTQLIAVADTSPAARTRAQKAYPGLRVTDDPAELLSSPEIDAIAVVTPVWTHFELSKAALENGKHIFVEKPLTSKVVQAEQLIELAAAKNRGILYGDTTLVVVAIQGPGLELPAC